MKLLYLAILLCLVNVLLAQVPEEIYSDKIKSVQFYQNGNQLSFPVFRLHGTEQLEIHFDDLDGNVKNLSYTYQLCNADWTPAMLSHFDYIKGFSQVRFTNYRTSSIAFTRYTHYQAKVPDKNCIPSRSGNYILKVFQNGDTSKLLFTRRMLVVDEKTSVAAQVQQPYNGQLYLTHQKLQFKVNMREGLSIVNPQQQVSVTILQNGRWDNAATKLKPVFFSRTSMDFNTENDAVFPAGKEWRWVDLRSFRFLSDRIEKGTYTQQLADIILRPDGERVGQKFNFYRDVNGRYSIEVTESINPFWQADYSTVHFNFIPKSNTPFANKELYVFGELTGYKLDDRSRMIYNAERGTYEVSLKLKQGFYDFCYVTVDKSSSKQEASFEFTEGNYWETENDYMILVYYRPIGGRADELIGFSTINSAMKR